jgi:hypothetical protein
VSAAALSPEGALAWVRSLSIDVRAAAVLDASGAVLAGDPALGARAAEALRAAGAARAPGSAGPVTGDSVHVGDLMAVRAGGHVVAAAVGPLALGRLVRCDLAAAAEALGGR